MSKYANKQFWVDAGDRAVASFFQALVTTNIFDSTGWVTIEMGDALTVSGGFALASLATSIAFRGGATGMGDRDGHTVDG